MKGLCCLLVVVLFVCLAAILRPSFASDVPPGLGDGRGDRVQRPKSQPPAPADHRDIRPLAELIRKAEPGAVINIPTGSYCVDELADLRPKDDDSTVINGLRIEGKRGLTLKAGDGPVAFYSNNPDREILQIDDSQDVILDGFSISHQVDVSCLAVCVSVNRSERVTIKNCDIHGSGAIGIALSETSGVKIQKNKIHNCSSSGVFSGYKNTGGEVSGNTFQDNGLIFGGETEGLKDTRKYDLDIEDRKNFTVRDNKFLPITPPAAPSRPYRPL